MASVDPVVFQAMRVGGLLTAVVAIAASILVFVLAGDPAALGRATLKVERVLPPAGARLLARTVEKFAGGFAVVRQPSRLLMALILSVPLWCAIAAGIWLGARAFHITFPYTGSFLMTALLVVGVAVPTPGAVGGFHEAFRIGATAFYGAPNDRAIGAAIVLHALSFLPVALLGIVFMAQAGLNLKGMRRIALDEEGEAVPGRPFADPADLNPGLPSGAAFPPPHADRKGGAG